MKIVRVSHLALLVCAVALPMSTYAVNADSYYFRAKPKVSTSPKAKLSISVTGDSSGMVGFALTAKANAADAQGKVQYSVADGAIPPGVLLDQSSGEISGVPTAAGSFNAIISAKDSSNTAQAQYSVVVEPKAVLSIAVTGDSSGMVGSVFTARVDATDVRGKIQFSVASGSLPPGVLLDKNSGEISGVPTAAGSFNAIISATDSLNTAQAHYSVVVEPKAVLSIAVTGHSSGMVGSELTAKVNAADAQGKVQFSVASGSLPPGVSLDKNSGEISGFPTAAGSFNAIISATDSSNTAQAQYSVVIADKLQISGIASQGMLGIAYSAKFTASGGVAPISLKLSSGTLPKGLTFSDGTISGIPSIPTTASNLVITATDSAGNVVDSRPFSILIGSASPKNCKDEMALGNTETRSYPIFPDGASNAFGVYCQQTYAGGGWTKIGSFNDVGETTLPPERRNLIKYNEVLILKNDNPSTPVKQVTCHTTATTGFAADGTKGYNCDPGTNISVRVVQGGANNGGDYGIYIGPDIGGPGCNWGDLTQVWGRHKSGSSCVAMGTGEASTSNGKWGTDTFVLYVR